MSTKKTKAQKRQERQNRERWIQRIQLVLGYGIIGVTFCMALFLNFRHALSPAVTVGLAILAAFRLIALRYELKRQMEENRA